MQALEAIYQRRAVKSFDPNYKIPEADVKKLFEAAQQSPSSFNIQQWRFVNVKNPELRSQIQAAAWNQAQVTEASMLLILCADLKAHERNPERYWVNAPEAVRNYLVPMIKPFYEGKEQLARDEAMRSVGLIAQTLMIAAKDMGLDTGPMIGFDQAKVAELINLPKDHAIGMMIVVGKALKPAHPKGGFLPLNEVVKVDRF
jgi:nitroreductase